MEAALLTLVVICIALSVVLGLAHRKVRNLERKVRIMRQSWDTQTIYFHPRCDRC